METEARYLAVGAATLAAAGAALAFVLWLAGTGLGRDTVTYDVVFDGVAGLDVDAEVVFSGLPVGRVTALALHEPDPTRVRARIKVLEETPVTEVTTAQLATQGVTGLSYVALSGGTGAPLPAPEDGVPTIPSVRSPVQALFEETPDVVAESAALLRELQGFATPGNQERVARILVDLEGATAAVRSLAETAAPAADRIAAAAEELAAAATDLRDLTAPLGEAASAAGSAFDATAGAARRVDGLLAEVDGALPGLLARTDAALAAAEARLAELDGLPDAVSAVASAGRSLDSALGADVPALAGEARAATASLAALTGRLAEDLPRLAARTERTVAGAGEDVDRVATEISALVRSLERVVRRIERDPAGFVLRGSRG